MSEATQSTEATPAHEHPVSVRECAGPAFAVAVVKTYNDGSRRTEHYTESQAREVLDGLKEALED